MKDLDTIELIEVNERLICVISPY